LTSCSSSTSDPANTAASTSSSEVPTTSTVVPTDTTTSISIAHLAMCTASDLDAMGGWQGATQTMLGGISFTNVSKSACTMYGFPSVELIDEQGAVVKERTLHGVSPASSTWTDKAHIFAVPPGKPDQAFIPLQFSCEGPVPDVRTVRVVLSDGTYLYAKPGGDPWTVESCVQGVSGPSTLSEGPVQPQPT
jgi:hypothetical protein